jgi:hypothetical protein
MNFTIELIRLVAVMLITFTHVRHGFSEGPMYYVLEVVPKFGTLILSVVSGYLFNEISNKNNKTSLTRRKIRSLLIPFLIANTVILMLVLVLKVFGVEVLNRLSYDYTLITEGLFSLSSPPINPPTYFIRDLFVIFLLIDLFKNRNYLVILFIVPLLLFGKILLRYDILLLFSFGVLFSKYRLFLNKIAVTIALICIASVLVFFNYMVVFKYTLTILLFINIMRIKIGFVKTGGYTYLLHLYHAPIIVLSVPFINQFIKNPYLNVILQIGIALLLSYIFFKFIKIFNLKVITGNR